MPPSPTGEGLVMVLALLFGVIFIDCRGDHRSSVIYKNIILFKKDRRGRRSLQICTIFVILIVGAIRNVFKENLRLAKWSSAGVQRTPLRFFEKDLVMVLAL